AFYPDVIAGLGDTLYVVWTEVLIRSWEPDYHDVLISKGDTLATGTTDIGSQVELPEQVTLLKNYPNPFNASTTIKFNLSETQVVELIVYDLLGKEISRLLEEERQAGMHSITFDASDLSSGVYFYSLKTGQEIKSRRMILLK
ncbi:MAG: T9SS type A sorting domain-containing protein, partial [Candidatus Zixiibacteriota bacterium]